MLRRGGNRRRLRRSVEQLESRNLLAALVTEFMAINDSALADDVGRFSDWIEVHNPSDQPISLNGWYLTDDADNLSRWQFPDDAELGPGEYKIVFASGDNRVGPEGEIHTDFRLNGGGEFLALVRPDGQTVEHGYLPEYPDQVADISFGLSSDASEQGFFSVPTPGAANAVAPVDDPLRTLVINEIMYHPSSEQVADEYIELLNRGNEPVNLQGWRLSGGVDFAFPDVTIAPNDYLVVAADPDAFAETYGQPADVGSWTGRLSNSSDTITLRDSTDRRVDRVTYADEGDWAQRGRGPVDRGHMGWVWLDDHDGGGKSLELVNSQLLNEYGQAWQASEQDLGTPGRANSRSVADAAPLIIDTQHTPSIPQSDDAVLVEARVIDEASEAPQVWLNWRVNGQPEFTRVSMNDDGFAGDRLAGDGVFVAAIPPQADLTVVEFYVEASDAAANSRTWPAPTADSGQVTNALYQVLDSFDPESVWQPGDHAAYYEVMTAAERAEFSTIDRESNAQMNATFISVNQDGTKVRYNAGVRIRGSGSRRANPPNNRINIPSDRPWEGVTAINLNVTTIQDQIAGSALFRLAGLPAADAKAITLISNGVNLMQQERQQPFYVHVEPLNGDFAEKHFPDDSGGNLYKGRRSNESPPGGMGAGLLHHGQDPGPYVSYTKLTNASEADWSDVINLTDVLNNAPDATYLEQVATVVDVDQWFRFMAFNALLGNTEGGLVNGDRQGDDYAMYRGVDDPRFVMVPHDLDSLFSGVTRGILNATNVAPLRRMMLHPDLRESYYQHVKDLIENVILTDDARIVIEDSLRGVQTPDQINGILNYLRNRSNYVLTSLVPEGVQLESFLPEQQGLRVSELSFAELHGRADYRAKSVRVNGLPAQFDNSNNWQLGSNSISVIGRARWDYLEDGSDPGPDWNQLGFVPGDAWKNGESQLGYGDRDERTVLQFGDDPDNKPITAYFRHEFNLADASRYLTLNLRLVRDDGAVVYLNGQEVVRSNLPEDVEITPQTLAINNVQGSAERLWRDFVIDPSLLRDGTNVIAVEVHQAFAASADLSFDLRLNSRFRQDTGIPLNPGVNRLLVEAMSGRNGTGDVVASEFIDVWYDDGDVQSVTDDLPAGRTVWSAANGPYQIENSINVPEGAELVIEPGTSVYFAKDARLVVNGILTARGQPHRRIRFTSIPGQPFVPDLPGLPDGPARWNGIQFRNSTSDQNVIAFADIEYAQNGEGSIGVISSTALVDNVSFRGTHRRMIFGNNASLVVRNSYFPDMFAENESPEELKLDNVAEQIKIIGRTPAGGQLLIEGNEFGTNKGHNDVIDADSNRVTNGPILQILNNVFHGAGDELLDLGGDVYVAGNLFQNVFKDDTTSDRGYANAISTGDAGTGTTVVVARNVFYDVDHAINLKNRTATIFENNTVVKIHPDFNDRFGHPNVGSAINLFVDEPRATPGRGAYAAGNIFWDSPRVFGNGDLPDGQVSQLQLFDNLLTESLASTSVGMRPGTILSLGSGNQIGDPRFVDSDAGDFRLRPGSAALNGIQSRDYGAFVPEGAWISGEPDSLTHLTSASLTVGGPGIFAYQYRVNGGAWSDSIAIGAGFDPNGTQRTDQLDLMNLADGDYTVEVIGQDFAGNWQVEPTVSRTWTVQRQLQRIVINEVLASNSSTLNHFGSKPDMVELYNAGSDAVNLRGYSLTDDPAEPTKFVFAQDEILQPGEYLQLFADDNQTPGIHLGFSLRREGEGVYLYQNKPAEPPIGVDAVVFGVQLADFSIGRVGPDAEWTLTVPTLGEANEPARLGDHGTLRINEWLAQSADQDDFVELYNPDTLPVALGGLYLSDATDGAPDRHPIAPLSFVSGRGFIAFQADGNTGQGADHLSFRLSSDQEAIGLVDSQLRTIDAMVYQPQTLGQSQGRLPDGGSQLATFDLPSPGWPNGTGFPGDLNQDGNLDVQDVDLMCTAIRSAAAPDDTLDLNRDERLSVQDLRYLIDVILGTSLGDANLDGGFDSSDFVEVFVAGEYEDGIPGNSTWAEGDWDCDGDFTTSDLVAALQAGGYVTAAQAQRPALADAELAAALDDLTNLAGLPPAASDSNDASPLAARRGRPIELPAVPSSLISSASERWFSSDEAELDAEDLDDDDLLTELARSHPRRLRI